MNTNLCVCGGGTRWRVAELGRVGAYAPSSLVGAPVSVGCLFFSPSLLTSLPSSPPPFRGGGGVGLWWAGCRGVGTELSVHLCTAELRGGRADRDARAPAPRRGHSRGPGQRGASGGRRPAAHGGGLLLPHPEAFQEEAQETLRAQRYPVAGRQQGAPVVSSAALSASEFSSRPSLCPAV